MCSFLRRRSFLKAAAAYPLMSAISTVPSAAASEDAASILRFDCKYKLHGDGWDQSNRRKIVAEAMGMVGEMSNPQLWKKANAATKDCKFFGDVWQQSAVANWFNDPEDVLLLVGQMIVLGARDQWIVNIRPYYSDDFDWGRANLNLVSISFDEVSTFRAKGEFDIELNLTRLGREGLESSPAAWAGVISHELLHNLGHYHEKGEYRPDLQINAFQQVIFEHFSDQDLAAASTFRCGGRSRR